MARVRHFPELLTRQSYWIAVLLPLLMPLAWSLRELPALNWAFAWLPLIILYVVIPMLDLLIGRDLSNPEIRQSSFYPDTLIPVAASVSFLLVLAWSLSVSKTLLEQQGVFALIGWLLSLGDIGGAVGINAAHELIHRRSRPLRTLGGLILSSVWYPGFKLEHPRWHHVHVATSLDPSSASAGANVYRQVPRALILNTFQSWKLAAAVARSKGRPAAGLFHEAAGWYALSLGLTLGVALTLGWVAAGGLVVQGMIAAALLETINFIEHYGLRRQQRPDGRYVTPDVTHSWDCDYWLSNAMLIQLPRHADHHTHPLREFSQLQRHTSAPLLPFGYPLLVMISLVPPFWRRLIDPLLPAKEGEPVATSR